MDNQGNSGILSAIQDGYKEYLSAAGWYPIYELHDAAEYSFGVIIGRKRDGHCFLGQEEGLWHRYLWPLR